MFSILVVRSILLHKPVFALYYLLKVDDSFIFTCGNSCYYGSLSNSQYTYASETANLQGIKCYILVALYC